MKTLILMRHAKSDWSNPWEADRARPLNKRGRRSATALGRWLRAQALVPDQILCSSALRAQETWAGLALPGRPDLRDSLYMAEPEQMLAELRHASGNTVLMIGHNPGIAGFAQSLVITPPDHDRFDDYPTGATLVVSFDLAAWSVLRPGTGTARHFIIPSDLG